MSASTGTRAPVICRSRGRRRGGRGTTREGSDRDRAEPTLEETNQECLALVLVISGVGSSLAGRAIRVDAWRKDVLTKQRKRKCNFVRKKGGVERLELVHDLLAPVICRSRGRRRQLEAEELPEKEAIETGRNRHSKKRTRSAWRLFWLSAGWAVVLLVALYASYTAWEQKKLAEQQHESVVKAEGRADEAELMREKSLQKLKESVRLRQALSGSGASLREVLETTRVDAEVRFSATAKAPGRVSVRE